MFEGLPDKYSQRSEGWKRGYLQGWDDADNPGDPDWTPEGRVTDKSVSYRLGWYTGFLDGLNGYAQGAKWALRDTRS